MMNRDSYDLRMQELSERSVRFNITEAEDEELSVWLEKVEAGFERWCEEEDSKKREAHEDEMRQYDEFISSKWGSVAGDRIYPFADEEKDAFTMAILQHSRLFLKVAYKEVKDYIHSQDAKQEGLYKAYEALQSYRSDVRDKVRLRNWICKIVRNTSITYRNKQLLAHPFISTEIVKEFHLQVSGRDLEQPQNCTERKELIRALQNAIVNLPKTKRDIVILRYVYGYKDVEIATSLGRPLGTIKKALHDSHAILRTFLEKQGIGKEDIGILVEMQSGAWLRQLCVTE